MFNSGRGGGRGGNGGRGFNNQNPFVSQSQKSLPTQQSTKGFPNSNPFAINNNNNNGNTHSGITSGGISSSGSSNNAVNNLNNGFSNKQTVGVNSKGGFVNSNPFSQNSGSLKAGFNTTGGGGNPFPNTSNVFSQSMSSSSNVLSIPNPSQNPGGFNTGVGPSPSAAPVGWSGSNIFNSGNNIAKGGTTLNENIQSKETLRSIDFKALLGVNKDVDTSNSQSEASDLAIIEEVIGSAGPESESKYGAAESMEWMDAFPLRSFLDGPPKGDLYSFIGDGFTVGRIPTVPPCTR